MNRILIRQWLCVVSVIGAIAGNALANILPFNGQTTGAVSNRFDVLFTPAGYVFGIWGLLYITWCVFTVYQLLPSQRSNPRLQRVTYLFALSGVVNVLWLWLWHHEYFALTVLVMLTLLGLLITIYLRLDVGRARASLAERLCVHTPFSLYLAWISVATIANITVYLRHVGWSGWGLSDIVWVNAMIGVATLLGVIACVQRRDYAFVAVLLWAFVGIASKQAELLPVYTGAVTASALLAVIAMARFIQSLRRPSGMQPA